MIITKLKHTLKAAVLLQDTQEWLGGEHSLSWTLYLCECVFVCVCVCFVLMKVSICARVSDRCSTTDAITVQHDKLQ